MKRKILSLLLSFTLCLTLLPMAAFAEEPDKISITTVDELLQFAKAVDNGEYDDKTDAVVSLDADLDLTGVAWKPIGSVFDGDGNLLALLQRQILRKRTYGFQFRFFRKLWNGRVSGFRIFQRGLRR